MKLHQQGDKLGRQNSRQRAKRASFTLTHTASLDRFPAPFLQALPYSVTLLKRHFSPPCAYFPKSLLSLTLSAASVKFAKSRY